MKRWLMVLAAAMVLQVGMANVAVAQDAAVPQGESARSTPAPTVNVNSATAEQFEALPGLGAKMAARIVEYREKNGPFK